MMRGIVPATFPIELDSVKEAMVMPLLASLAGGIGGNMLGGMGATALGAGGIGSNLAGLGGGILGSGAISALLNKLRGRKKPVALSKALAGGIGGGAGSLAAMNQMGMSQAVPGQLGAQLPAKAGMGNYEQLLAALQPYLSRLTGG